MAANDYLMRQIEDMARFLGKVLFVKTEETIPLFDEQGNVLESGLLYKRLCAMLEEGDANSAENLLFDEVEAHPDPGIFAGGCAVLCRFAALDGRGAGSG